MREYALICVKFADKLCVMTQKTQNTASEPVYLTVKEVADRLRVSVDTVYRRARAGEFPGAFRTRQPHGDFRIPVSALSAFLNNHEPQQTPASGQEVSPAGDSEPGPQDGGAAAHTPPGSLPEAQRA